MTREQTSHLLAQFATMAASIERAASTPERWQAMDPERLRTMTRVMAEAMQSLAGCAAGIALHSTDKPTVGVINTAVRLMVREANQHQDEVFTAVAAEFARTIPDSLTGTEGQS